MTEKPHPLQLPRSLWVRSLGLAASSAQGLTRLWSRSHLFPCSPGCGPRFFAVGWRPPPAPCQVGLSPWQLASPKPARESLGERWELRPWRTIGEVISCPHASCVLLATSQSWVPAPLKRKERHKGVDTKTQRTQEMPQSLWTQRGRLILQKPKAGLDPALKSGSLSSPERQVRARCPAATDNPGFSWGSPGAPPSWRIAVTRPQEPPPQGF